MIRMVYLLQTRFSVAFCHTVEDLHLALLNRPTPAAMLHTADDFEPLRHLAGISQLRIADNNIDEKIPIEQIAMPTTVTEMVCLKAPEYEATVSLNLMNSVQTGEWAISALNGFCTAPNDIELCKLLDGGSLAYPVAQCLETSHETAVMAARQNYVKRFFSRYWYNAEQTFLPQQSLEFFYDRYFQEREKRRAVSLSDAYLSFQRTKIAMGW